MKKATLCKFLAGALVCAQLTACGGVPGNTTITVSVATDSSTAESAASSTSQTVEFTVPTATFTTPLTSEWPVLYDENLTPKVSAFTVDADFGNVINGDLINSWSADARKMLLENGFLVVNSGANEFYENYERNRYSYTPNYVTVDALLHTYHLYYLYLQRGVEEKELTPILTEISRALQAESLAQLEALRGTEWENAALRNAAYFSVGLSLLDPDATLPDAVADLAGQELALIDDATEHFIDSPLMNLNAAEGDYTVQEDYTQYIPRSYYTQSETLKRYFKAMMWYGRMNFVQKNEDLNRSALLMNLALQDSGALENWTRLYAVTSFFAGANDDASFIDYAPILTESYDGWPAVKDLVGNESGWNAFVDGIAKLRPAAINSMPIYEFDDVTVTESAYRFMGQRFTFDGVVFRQLTYRNVAETDGRQRLLPDALDLPAALGSDVAVGIMDDEGLTDYSNYAELLEKTRTALKDAPASAWTASLYAGWLDTLRPLIETKGEGYPQFMQSDIWATRNLASFLGSWAELKHDSALYSKQNYAEMGGAAYEEVDDRGYVEAEPVVFGRLAALSQVTANGLAELGVLSDADKENLDRMYELNRRLMVIAEKELKDEKLTDEEFDLIRTVGGQLEHFWNEAVSDQHKEGAYFTPMEFPAALVADVSTNPNGSVLQVGTDVGNIYVIVNVDGQPRIACGTVFSFFQFEQPSAERMTDEAWWIAMGKMPDKDGETHWQDRMLPVDWSSRFSVQNPYQP